jgi:hypothetical protein
VSGTPARVPAIAIGAITESTTTVTSSENQTGADDPCGLTARPRSGQLRPMPDEGRRTRNRHLGEVVFLVAVPVAVAAAGAGGAWVLASILAAWLVVGLVEYRVVRARRSPGGRSRRLPPRARRYQIAAIAAWVIAFAFLGLALIADGRFLWAWIAIWAVGIALQLRASSLARDALRPGRGEG